MFLRSLIAILSLVWIPTAHATLVWFETTHLSGDGMGGMAGGPGQTLNLICDLPLGVCNWQVSMKATFQTGVHGWDLDLLTAPGNGVSVSNVQIPAGSPFTHPSSTGTPGAGASLLRNAGGQTFTAVPPQTMTLLTFTLTKTLIPGEISIDHIWGGASSAEFFAWATQLGEYDVVQFGPNPAAPALPGQYGALPLIRMVGDIPEPASLSLLVLGAAVCLRRTRGRRVHGQWQD